MKMKCDIICDLLPLYVDGLTSEESNEWIQEHLQKCEACNQKYIRMKEYNPPEALNENSKTKEPLIKYNRRMKLLKGSLVSVIILLVGYILFSMTFRGITVFTKEEIESSEIYSQGEIKTAIAAAKQYFKATNPGMVLTEISYVEEMTKYEIAHATSTSATEVMCFSIQFVVLPWGANEWFASWERNDYYNIIVRKDANGLWKVVNMGQG